MLLFITVVRARTSTATIVAVLGIGMHAVLLWCLLYLLVFFCYDRFGSFLLIAPLRL